MQNDLLEPSQDDTSFYNEQLFDHMSELSRHRVSRLEARAAVQELWLIQLDDEDLANPESQKEHAPAGLVFDSENKEHADQCDQCYSLPQFLSEENRRFKVVRSKCKHFVAVSYCWPKDSDETPKKVKQSYHFRKIMADGSSHDISKGPPDSVMDRAIQYAREEGLRQLWIDAVCLPQDDSLDHQLGIQAMDYVYQRATKNVGLLDKAHPEIEMLQAISAMVEWSRTQKLPEDCLLQVRALIRYMNWFTNDQFHQRAWILQEEVSASNMILDIPIDPDFRSRDDFPNFTLRTLPLENMGAFLSLCSKFCLAMFPEGFPSEDISQEWADMCRDYMNLFPSESTQIATLNNARMIGGSNFGGGARCSAALAIRYLHRRRCLFDSDQLAIAANMCDYEERLDTRKVKDFPHLSVAFMALALVNGDLSVLLPEMYDGQIGDYAAFFGWCPPFRTAFQHLNSREFRSNLSISLNVPALYQIKANGLQCPATTWHVDQPVDFTPLQTKWRSTWQSLWAYRFSPRQRPEESKEAFQHRCMRLHNELQRINSPGQISEEAVREFFEQNSADFKRAFNEDRAKDHIPDILIDVLTYACQTGHESLANNIWLNVRNDYHNPTMLAEDETYLPDRARDVVYDLDLLEKRHEIIRLDEVNGSLAQMWLIHRIIEEGYVWCGRAQKGNLSREAQTENAERTEPSKSAVDEDKDALSTLPEDEAEINVQPKRSFRARALARHIRLQQFRISMDADNQGFYPASMAAIMEVVIASKHGIDPSRYDLQGEIAPFNVDEPCMIAIPYDADWEQFPRPAEKAMRACWVVEPVMEVENSMAGLSIKDQTDDPTSGNVGHDLAESHNGEETSAAREEVPSDQKTTQLQVMAKVKGMWPPVEFSPQGNYCFV